MTHCLKVMSVCVIALTHCISNKWCVHGDTSNIDHSYGLESAHSSHSHRSDLLNVKIYKQIYTNLS